jgi:hypothetical protein
MQMKELNLMATEGGPELLRRLDAASIPHSYRKSSGMTGGEIYEITVELSAIIVPTLAPILWDIYKEKRRIRSSISLAEANNVTDVEKKIRNQL